MKKILEKIKLVFDSLGKCVVPMMPIFIGVGMIKVTSIILGPQALNILKEGSSTLKILDFTVNAGYYFIPIYIGFSSAKVFKTNEMLGGLMGGILLSPDFVNYVNEGTTLSFLNIPVTATTYANQLIPVVMAVYVMSIIYKFLDMYISEKIKDIFVPMLTIIIMIPIELCAIGPIGVAIGNGIVAGVLWLMNLGPVGAAIIAVIVPFQVAACVASINLTIMILLLTTGADPGFMYAMIVFNINLGLVTLAIYFRNKEPGALASGLTACVAGVGEPAIFNYIIKDVKAIIPLCIGDFVGTYYGVMMGAKTFALGSCGVFGIATTIGEGSSVLHATIGILIACIIGFSGSYILHKKNA